MANQLPVMILTVLTILLLIEMCTTKPYHGDTDAGHGGCDKNVPHVTVINSTTGAIIDSCRKCPGCPYSGHGLNIPCNGQNVTESQNFECVPCVSGMNYSTGETNQCQPCLPRKCESGERIVGKCENDGDKRRCESCELKHWYYNVTQMTCLPCACENMTSEIKKICEEIGFGSDACETDQPKKTPNTTPHAPSSFQNNGEVWRATHTLILVVAVFVIIVLFVVCFFCQTRIKGCIWQMCCFKKGTSSIPSVMTGDGHAHNGNSAERTSFLRQFSCPVTQNEVYAVINTPHAVAFTLDSNGQENVELLNQECKKLQKLKFSALNAEVCRKICLKLKENVDSGMGYTTLAGYMDFSMEQVREFEAAVDPCKEMLDHWSKTKENNVLKLKSLVEKLKRDDIVELLEGELEKVRKKCGCPKCAAVLRSVETKD